jgi:hypothetical protein
MKKYLISACALALIFSCHSNQPEKEQAVTDTINSAKTTDTVNAYKDTHYFWFADFAGKKGFTMVRNRPIPADSLTTDHIIQSLNDLYPEIKLSFVGISNDSMFLNIDKSNYLTNSSGSSGAEAYLAEATYNLTEIKGISFVHFNFKKGNHASPGTYSRTDFVHD